MSSLESVEAIQRLLNSYIEGFFFPYHTEYFKLFGTFGSQAPHNGHSIRENKVVKAMQEQEEAKEEEIQL